jgi:membrane-associated progesterone receptor component
LLEFDGRKCKKIYIGVNGRVYDVTRGAGFYGPGEVDAEFTIWHSEASRCMVSIFIVNASVSPLDGPYGNFAGRDASRGLAKGSFDKSMLTDPVGKIDTLADLARDEWDELRQWTGHFQNKYEHLR